MKNHAWYGDFHSHSHFDDGNGSLEEYVKQALQLNFAAFGFSGHTPMPKDDNWHIRQADFLRYVEEAGRLKEHYRHQIELYLGLEFDYLEHEHFLQGSQQLEFLDYTIGSLHYFYCDSEHGYLSFDGSRTDFELLLEVRFKGEIRQMVEHYFALQIEMVKNHSFGFLAHCDLIKKLNTDNRYFSTLAPWYREASRELLVAVKHSGHRLEINSGGLARGAVKELYPAPEIIADAIELQIPLVLCSDAHRSSHIGHYFSEARAILSQLGATSICTLKGNQWQTQPLL